VARSLELDLPIPTTTDFVAATTVVIATEGWWVDVRSMVGVAVRKPGVVVVAAAMKKICVERSTIVIHVIIPAGWLLIVTSTSRSAESAGRRQTADPASTDATASRAVPL